jgi:N-hydroxyarylamine O-acetyltransferase
VEQATPHEPHRLAQRGEGFALQTKLGEEWQDLYHFDLHEQLQPDYEVSNWFLCTHPQSPFVQGIIAARAAPGERHALRNTRYAIHRPGGETQRRFVANVREYREVLAGPLQVRIPDVPGLDDKLARMIAANPPA